MLLHTFSASSIGHFSASVSPSQYGWPMALKMRMMIFRSGSASAGGSTALHVAPNEPEEPCDLRMQSSSIQWAAGRTMSAMPTVGVSHKSMATQKSNFFS